MDEFKNIQSKLEGFIKKYYTNELIKGTIMFFAIGLLYFLCTLFIEYVLWLNSTFRTILFWLFVGVELALIIKFIIIPVAKLFKLQEGINYEDASKIIGKHFPQVNDKLLNVLQLHKDPIKSELLLASISQKSAELSPIPFKLAINFKTNLKYLKYAAIPLAIILIAVLSGNFNLFSDSFERVVHYRTAYEPPAPFQFYVVNNDLNAIENTDFKLHLTVSGEVIPENVEIHYNNESYLLQQKQVGEFEYVFSQPRDNIRFQLSANNVTSRPYELQVIQSPSLLSFEMLLNYPKYINKPSETLKSTGNANVPEGTSITWLLNTKATDTVQMFALDTLSFLKKDSGGFQLSKSIYNDLNYSISTSNNHLKHYENLSFNIAVIKDQSPELNIKMETDSVDLQTLYFYGQASDDYGFSKLQLVYYPTDNDSDKQYQAIPVSSSNISEFITAFPNDLKIEEGIPYSLYFQVFDNDALHHYKSTKSPVFTYRKRTKEEEEQKQLNEQSETIKDLNKSLKTFDEQDKQLEELSKTQKEKSELNFNDKKKLESFFKRQKQQDDLMKNFNKELKDNLKEFQKDQPKEDTFKNDLEKRLQENEEQLKEDEKLLEELQKLQDKINKEEFTQKLDELAKQNKNKKRSLEQLLELTKRFYVAKKLEKQQQQLEGLSNEQEKLSDEPDDVNTKESQDELNKAFEDFKKQMDQLEKDNKALKKPLEIPRDKLDEREVDENQQKASDELEKQKQSQDQQQNQQSKTKAKTSQKKAAMKMKQMSNKMAQAMQASSGEQMQEDVDMLRQILDNLLLFSFDQEALMNQFKTIEINHNKYAAYLRKQSDLKEHFKHIDDSLFALSLREPKLSETVNKEISEVYFNIDKSLDQFAENQMVQGISNQQFTITAANNLSNFLSDVLDNMNEQLNPSPGQGQGDADMQLPDIIMNQEELNKMMQDGLKKDEQGKPQDGKEGKSGKDGTEKQEGDGDNDSTNQLLYQIYQKQEELRQALEDKLAKEGKTGNGDNLLKKMEEVEMDLLNKGFNNQTLQKMIELQHQLLKLENATFQQGFDNKRQSKSNQNEFINNTNNQIPTAKEYFNSTEILNRQALPLQELYKKKVQEYFKSKDDKF
ncbi:ATPase [Yeosuana aromativorans]|uniref:ATPase n=1 Tax=Yeosuana aromativorans TaxID=288019 RepID=A0A8J3BLA4_9FLAO|nr:DUF4175 family protein [Yeosuana aromativorans]GGK30521.1 ATPase [Yeosuana aromativorans]